MDPEVAQGLLDSWKVSDRTAVAATSRSQHPRQHPRQHPWQHPRQHFRQSPRLDVQTHDHRHHNPPASVSFQVEGAEVSFLSKLVLTKTKAYAAVLALAGILALVIDLIWEEALYAHIGGLGA